MTSNVVSIDRRAIARSVSAEARRRYIAQRSEKEVAAIQRNRFARLRSTNRWWLSITACAALVGAGTGAGGLLWVQSVATPVATAAVPDAVTVVPATAAAAIRPAKPEKVAVSMQVEALPSGIASLPRGIEQMADVALPPTTPTALATLVTGSVSMRMPTGGPTTQLAPLKPKVFGAAATQSARVLATPSPTPVASPAKAVEKPTTQYEATPNGYKMPGSSNSIGVPPAASGLQPAPGIYSGIGVPVDGVLQIQIGRDPTIKQVKIGERLPTGEVLRRANSETGQVETSERTFSVKVQ